MTREDMPQYEMTDLERVEFMHKLWKEKQEQVPHGPKDVFIYRDEHGVEVSCTRSDYKGFNPDLLVSVVYMELRESEKKAI